MANSNFIVHNGLTVGPLTIDAATGDITTSGNVSITGSLGVSQISKNDSSVSILDTGTGSSVTITIDGTTEQTVDADGISLAAGNRYAIAGASVLNATTLGSAVVNSSLTAVGTLGSLAVTGAVTAGSFSGPLTGAVTGNASTATVLQTARAIGGVNFDGSAAINLPGVNTTGNQNTTGSAATLTTPRAINGVNFDGSAAITVTAAAGTLSGATLAAGVTASSLTSVGTLTALSVTGAATAGSFTAGGISVGATADAITSTGTLTLDPNPIGSGGLVVIQGNLQVTGTTTTIDSATLSVGDLNITVAKDAVNAAAANGAGLTVAGANATLLYTSSTDTWNFNKNVVASLNGNASTATVLQTARAIGGVNFDGSAAINLPGVNTTGNQNTTGSAATLTTPRAINGVNFNGSAAITVTAAAGTLSGATLASGVTASSLTSVGTLTALAVSGAVTVNSGNAATAIVNGGTNGVGNIGASGAGFNTVFAKSTSAQYADVAENYAGDAAIEPGTVVHFGGEQEVSVCDADMCSAVAGVVSTNPAYLMNSEIEAEHVVAVAFTGRVPCKVTGTVHKGDLMVSAGNGRARAEANPRVGTVIGKALENSEGETVIEVVVGR